MSQINTDNVWRALGSFFEMFPEEDRVYWTTFWEAYSDIVADLWGLAFQVDRSKNLFETTATFERREVLVNLSRFNQTEFASFRVSSVVDHGGHWVLRGFVPRDMRSFKTLPASGLLRIGVDLIPYSQVNVSNISGGAYDGFVREASFVLNGTPPHDYGDTPDFNDDFSPQSVTLSLRIAHAAGSTTVDAEGTGSVNGSGLLVLGTETLEYESVTVLGGRYVFQLATGWQDPDTNAESLTFSHPVSQTVTVYRHDTGRWQQSLVGRGRVASRGDARLIIDDQPTPVASSATLVGQYQMRENDDFDVSATVALSTWDDPTILSSAKRVFARLWIGTLAYVSVIDTRLTGLGV